MKCQEKKVKNAHHKIPDPTPTTELNINLGIYSRSHEQNINSLTNENQVTQAELGVF